MLYERMLEIGLTRRETQEMMMGLVSKAIADREIHTIEAPTGTGKSYAYLIPVIELAGKRKTIVSTYSKNLQDQLARDVEKLVKEYAELTGKKIKYVIVKGKGNYLCLDKLYKILKGYEEKTVEKDTEGKPPTTITQSKQQRKLFELQQKMNNNDKENDTAKEQDNKTSNSKRKDKILRLMDESEKSGLTQLDFQIIEQHVQDNAHWDGDLSEFTHNRELIRILCIDDEYCTSAYQKNCKYKDECYYYNNLKLREITSDIIITNHSITALKYIKEEADDRILIIDEAHEFDKVVREIYAEELTDNTVERFINKLKEIDPSIQVNINPSSLFGTIIAPVEKQNENENEDEDENHNKREKDVSMIIRNVFFKTDLEFMLSELERYYEQAKRELISKIKTQLLTTKSISSYALEIITRDKDLQGFLMYVNVNKQFWESVDIPDSFDNFEDFEDIAEKESDKRKPEKQKQKKESKETQDKESRILDDLIHEYERLQKSFGSIKRRILLFTKKDTIEPEEVYQMKVEKRISRKQSIHAIVYFPVISQPILKDIHTKFSTIVCTSATLSETQLQLQTGIVGKHSSLPQVFDYSNVILTVKDVNPKIQKEEWEQILVNTVKQAINEYDTVMVLLTNYKQLDLLHRHFENEAVFVGGKYMSFKRAMQEIRPKKKKLIIGVDSLWTGIDLPGRKCIIISRLPYEPPTDASVRVRYEYFESQGIDQFQLSTIDALTKFKQGIGRLMRTETDSGEIIVCDNRIKNFKKFKSYLDMLKRWGVTVR